MPCDKLQSRLCRDGKQALPEQTSAAGAAAAAPACPRRVNNSLNRVCRLPPHLPLRICSTLEERKVATRGGTAGAVNGGQRMRQGQMPKPAACRLFNGSGLQCRVLQEHGKPLAYEQAAPRPELDKHGADSLPLQHTRCCNHLLLCLGWQA